MLKQRRSLVAGLREGIRKSVIQQAGFLQWDTFEIRNIKKLAGNEAVVIVRHQTGDALTLKMRWWVTKEQGTWQVFDFEDLDVGLRVSTLASSLGAAGLADPGFIQGVNNLRDALVAIAKEDPDTAERKLRAAAPVKLPTKLEALRYMVSGVVRLHRNQPEEALKEWEKAAAFHPDMPALDLFKGLALNHLAQWDKALKHLETYKALLGDDTNVCRELGLALRGVGRSRRPRLPIARRSTTTPSTPTLSSGFCKRWVPGTRRTTLAPGSPSWTCIG
jgi:tetratricopeptide (TPR) repeat protein